MFFKKKKKEENKNTKELKSIPTDKKKSDHQKALEKADENLLAKAIANLLKNDDKEQ